jgi:hypothetical protein
MSPPGAYEVIDYRKFRNWLSLASPAIASRIYEE